MKKEFLYMGLYDLKLPYYFKVDIMDDVILETLRSVYTPEHLDTVLLLANSIHDAGDRLFTETISHVAGQIDQYEPLDLADLVVSHLRGVAVGFLGELEIQVSDEIPLDTLAKLVDVFHKFDSSEDNEDILNIIEVESDPKEVLMQIIILRSDLKEEDLFEHLYDPSEDQIRLIYDLVIQWSQTVDVVDDAPIETDVDLIQVARGILGDRTHVDQAIQEGMPTGVGIEAMLNVYGDSMVGLSLETLIPNLAGLHILAGNNPTDIVEEVLESARGYTVDDDLSWEQSVRKLTVESLGDLVW